MPFLIAKDTKVDSLIGQIDVRKYWTGKQGLNGGPQETLWKHEAKPFSTATGARECANTHKGLRDSEEWKVVRRV